MASEWSKEALGLELRRCCTRGRLLVEGAAERLGVDILVETLPRLGGANTAGDTAAGTAVVAAAVAI